MRRPSYGRLALYSLIALLLVLLAVELVARRMVPHELAYVGDEKYWILAQHTNLYGQWDDAQLFRIENYTATARKKMWPQRVICLGSSSTYGAGLEKREEAFPGVLHEMFPDVEVINAGFGGYNSYQLAIYFEEVLVRLNPDVLVFYYGGNEGYGFTTKRFYPRAKEVVAKMRDRGITDRSSLEFAVLRGTANPIALALYHLLDGSKAFLWWRDRVVTAGVTTEMVYRPMVPNDPRLRMKPTTEQIFTQLAALTAKRKITLLLVPEISSTLDHAGPPVWSVMQTLCRQGKAQCVDPLVEQPRLDDTALFLDSSHLTVAGHRRLAEVIRPTLQAVLEAPDEPAAE
ncbi:MAG: SGNH/GDSL hydrolase family protein [Candidatus Lernaella stagnicola]|nr:SGNH/GDSL hydrolase family protein [Candidatus Lernaella stagnicola]